MGICRQHVQPPRGVCVTRAAWASTSSHCAIAARAGSSTAHCRTPRSACSPSRGRCRCCGSRLATPSPPTPRRSSPGHDTRRPPAVVPPAARLLSLRLVGTLWAEHLDPALDGLALHPAARRRIRRGAYGPVASAGALLVVLYFIYRDTSYGLTSGANGLIPFDDPDLWGFAALGRSVHMMMLGLWIFEWLFYGYLLWLQVWILAAWVPGGAAHRLRARARPRARRRRLQEGVPAVRPHDLGVPGVRARQPAVHLQDRRSCSLREAVEIGFGERLPARDVRP